MAIFDKDGVKKALMFTVVVITSTIIFSATYRNHQEHIEALENQIELREEIIKAREITHENETDRLKEEYDACLQKVQDPSKRNRMDMQKYITTRYPEVPIELAELIAVKTDELSKKHNMDFSLIVGLMQVESAYNPFAVSSVKARGLLQVMHTVWGKKFKIKKASDLHDIELNIDTGIQVLKHYLDKNEGNVTKALQNYNGSTGTDFSNKVFIAVGKFTAFRNNTYHNGKGVADDEQETAESATVPDSEGRETE